MTRFFNNDSDPLSPFDDILMPDEELLEYIPGADAHGRNNINLLQEVSEQFDHHFMLHEDDESPASIAEYMEHASMQFRAH